MRSWSRITSSSTSATMSSSNTTFLRSARSLNRRNASFSWLSPICVAQRVQLVAERRAAGVLAQHQAGLLPADALRRHDLIGRGVLQHAVLVDARLVREGVAPDDRLVRLHVEAGDGGQQFRGPQQQFRGDPVVIRDRVLPGADRHHDLFQRRVAGTLADAVDRAFHLARAGAEGGDGVGDPQTQIVMVVRGQNHLLDPRHAIADVRNTSAPCPRAARSRRCRAG